MELFGTTVVWKDGTLIVYDKTQGVQNVQRYLGSMLGFATDDIRVIAPFVGGAFGLGLRPQYQVFLAALAAQVLKRSVRVSLTRQQMFGLGYRPVTWQRVRLGAAQDGGLAAIIHDAVAATSRFEDYTEKTLQSSGMLYRCDNATFDYKLARLDPWRDEDALAATHVEGDVSEDRRAAVPLRDTLHDEHLRAAPAARLRPQSLRGVRQHELVRFFDGIAARGEV
jgi:xanthine dehydrogenase YagR molybdenum-binding subunit